MSDAEDTKQCPNCKLDILSANFTIHYVHCQRNFYLCSKCERPVNYGKRVEHDKTDHVTVHCRNCHFALEKYHLDDHLNYDCPNREVKCKICDIDVRANDLEEHEDYCGARTEKCSECGEFVMLKYKTLHLDSNHTFIKLFDEPGPSPSWQNGRRTLYNFIPDLSSRTPKPSSVRRKKSNESVRKSRNSDVDEWPVLSGLRSLEISEEKQENLASANASGAVQSEQDEDSDFLCARETSLGINSELWGKDARVQEKALKKLFKPLIENELSAEKSVEKNLFENHSEKEAEPRGDALKNNFNFFYDKQESVKLPCEFCGDLIVSNDLILHQSRCSLYMRDTYDGRGASYKMPYFVDNMEKKIACGICNKFFRLSLLENHELHCQRNSIKSPKSLIHSKNLKAVNMKTQPGLQNGLESSSPQVTRMGTRSEWLSELSKNTKGGQEMRNNLNHPESGVIARTNKASRKNRRAPSPPGR